SDGMPSIGTSSVRRRTQPASKWPQARRAPPVAASAPAARRTIRREPRVPPRQDLFLHCIDAIYGVTLCFAPKRRRWLCRRWLSAAMRRSRSRKVARLCANLNFQALRDRLYRDDVALELQLVVSQAGGDPEQLRQVEDRHLERTSGRLLQLQLPGVEGQVAERARRHHRVRAGVGCLLDRLQQLSEGYLLARLD